MRIHSELLWRKRKTWKWDFKNAFNFRERTAKLIVKKDRIPYPAAPRSLFAELSYFTKKKQATKWMENKNRSAAIHRNQIACQLNEQIKNILLHMRIKMKIKKWHRNQIACQLNEQIENTRLHMDITMKIKKMIRGKENRRKPSMWNISPFSLIEYQNGLNWA